MQFWINIRTPLDMNLSDFGIQLIIPIMLLFLVFIVLFLTLILIYKTRRDHRDYIRKSKASLDYTRELMERRLYNLNNRLQKNVNLWSDVNHLVFDAQQQSLEHQSKFGSGRGGSNDLSRGLADRFGIDSTVLELKSNQVALLMPLHKDFDLVYDAINRGCDAAEFYCIRSDQQYISGSITKHILELIISSEFIVCVIDGRNPNVFYELGISHALNKKVVIVSREGEEIPFDISSTGILIYNNIYDLERKITKTMNELNVN